MDAVSQAVEQACGAIKNPYQTVWVGFSGGMDSHVLLHALSHARTRFPALTIKAVHVNHQLQASSDGWAKHCQDICKELALEYVVLKVDARPQKGESPEEAARVARYAAIADCLSDGDVLVTAHHLDDQAETFLLQLMRGSGLAGLAAMPGQRELAHIQLWRPLLSVSRQEIEAYAKQHDLRWIEDPSNADTDIRRNFIRHQVITELKKQWPNASQLIAQSASHLANTDQLLNDFLSQDHDRVLLAPDVMCLDALAEFQRDRQFHIIRHWYMRLGLAQPGADKLTIILDEIIAAREDATPCLKWQNSQLIRHRRRLLLLPLWPEITEQITINYDPTPLVTDHWSLAIDAPDISNMTIRLGDYSESVKVNGQTKKLKALYKEKGLPVQLRGLMPRIYINDQLMLIPTIWQADDCTVASYSFDFNRLGSASTHPHSLLSTLTSG